jgi:DNA-binding NtrC family response regulator
MKRNVLIVEDDFGTRLLLKSMLLKIDPDTHVDGAQSAEIAYRLLNDAGVDRPGYDLVMADFGLPGSNGLVLWELCSKKFPALEFLFVSGISHEDWLRKVKDHEEWPTFIRKPVAERDLKRFWDQRFNPVGEAGS